MFDLQSKEKKTAQNADEWGETMTGIHKEVCSRMQIHVTQIQFLLDFRILQTTYRKLQSIQNIALICNTQCS